MSQKTHALGEHIPSISALSFLFVDGEEDMWWLIAMSGLMMLLHGVYVTAERAALPNIVDEDDLITANAIDSASWSTVTCVGAMLGGIVVSIWGTDLAFIIDSYTFLLSLLLIPLTFECYDESVKGPIIKTALSNIKIDGRDLQDKKLLRIVFAKSSWNLAEGSCRSIPSPCWRKFNLWCSLRFWFVFLCSWHWDRYWSTHRSSGFQGSNKVAIFN